MRATAVFRALGPIDARAISRDSLLAWMAVIPLLLGLLMRWVLPQVDAFLLAEFEFDLVPYHHLLASYLFVGLAPMTVGMVIGFLLLDERDDNTLSALLVTPLSFETYLAYRLGLPVLMGIVTTALGMSFAGLVTLAWGPLLLVLALASLQAPLMSLALACFAENKVQGFALVKGLGGVLLAPVLAWWVAFPWQLLAGVVPSYWPLRAYWWGTDPGSGFWLALVVGLAVNLAALALLLRRFHRVIAR